MIVEMLCDMTGNVLWDGGECQLSSMSSVDTARCKVQYIDGRGVELRPQSGYGRLRHPGLAWQATMVAAGDSLPTRNEEYATREYWYALTHQFCFSFSTSLLNI
jgi:hypothetical protein